jgi:hypothetical protein
MKTFMPEKGRGLKAAQVKAITDQVGTMLRSYLRGLRKASTR